MPIGDETYFELKKNIVVDCWVKCPCFSACKNSVLWC